MAIADVEAATLSLNVGNVEGFRAMAEVLLLLTGGFGRYVMDSRLINQSEKTARHIHET